MKLNRIHAVIGLLLVLVPFMAFSREFKTGFSMLAGAVIAYFAINSIHIELRKKHRRPHRHDTFVESKPSTPRAEPMMEEQMVEEPKEDVIEKIEIIEPSSPPPDTEDEPEL